MLQAAMLKDLEASKAEHAAAIAEQTAELEARQLQFEPSMLQLQTLQAEVPGSIL